MAENGKKKTDRAKDNQRVIFTAAIIALIVLIIYGVSFLIGGAFHDFCSGAIVWVLLGIGLAAYLAHSGQSGGNPENREDEQ